MTVHEKTNDPMGERRAVAAILGAISEAFPVPGYLPADAKTKGQKKRLKKLTKKILSKDLTLKDFL